MNGNALRTSTVRRLTVLGLLTLFALSCSLLTTMPAPLEIATPVVVTSVLATSTSTPAVLPTATLPPTATPNPCPPRSDIAPPGRDQDLDTTIAAVQDYLNQGGDPGRVQLGQQEGMQQADLTGDGVSETVFVFVDPDLQQIPPKGHLVIYACRSGSITTLYHYEPGDWYGLEFIGIGDLTEDGVADLAFSEVSCGAHTCWHTPHVWSWRGNDFKHQMGAEFQFPYPWYTLEAGTLVVESQGVGSVGAGPQRTVTTTLAWAGSVITITDEKVAPPTFRYHAFLDGDRALGAGDFETAESMYRRVVDDPSLEEWGAFTSTDEEYTWLVALGRWRLMTLSAYLEDPLAAESIYTELSDSIAPGATGYPVVGLAERFWRGYQRKGDVPDGCNYALGGAEAALAVDFLNTFGYANPFYTVEYLCPFTVFGVADLPF